MRFPLDGEFYYTVGFNEQASYGPHEGVDLNLPGNDCGTLLKLISNGEVVHSSDSTKDYGNLTVVKIDGPWGTRYIRYCHQEIRYILSGVHDEGEAIGTLGTTGNSSGCHLHFDILKNKPSNWRFYSKNVTTYFEDPIAFIKKWKSVIITPPMTDEEKKVLQFINENKGNETNLESVIRSWQGAFIDLPRVQVELKQCRENASIPSNPGPLTVDEQDALVQVFSLLKRFL